jgi:hypothetical protein
MDTSEVSFGGNESYEGDSEPSQNEPSEDLSLASPFLEKIPAQDRAIVGRYIKDWDAGVTKKFQEIHGQYKPYKALGPPEQLQQYVNFANNFRADPENVFRLMWQGMQEQYGEDFDKELLRVLQLEEDGMSEEYQYAPEEQQYAQQEEDPTQIQLQNMAQELEDMRSWKESQEQEQVNQQEAQQLDGVLSAMHTKYGDFDDNWILVRLAEHGNVAQAVQEWNQMIGKYSQGTQRQAPKVMGGQGGVPNGQIKTDELRGKARRETVAQMLEGLGQ